MKKFGAFILLIIVLAISNPGIEQHKQAYRETFKRQNAVANFLGIGNIGAAMLTYDNYVVFSVTRMEQEVVGIGVLGFVMSGDHIEG